MSFYNSEELFTESLWESIKDTHEIFDFRPDQLFGDIAYITVKEKSTGDYIQYNVKGIFGFLLNQFFEIGQKDKSKQIRNVLEERGVY